MSGAGGQSSGGGSSAATGGAVALGGTSGSLGTGGVGGADGAAELTLPILRSGKYVLEFESIQFEVDPERGGRVTRFSLGEQSVVVGTEVTGNETNWGSTFWPSPQAPWDWPPIASIDSQPYAAALDGTTIVLTSPAPAATGPQVSVVKRFSANLTARAIELEFLLKNEATTAKSWAPWQVTRVGPNGLTFFTTGATPVYNALEVTHAAGVTWFKHPEGLGSSSGSPKLIADAGEPWLAHATGNLVFIKTFPAVIPAEFAPAEGEVELFAVANYVEIEPQGPYTLLEPGTALTWKIRWYLRERPAEATASVGDAALLSFVRSVVHQ